ncbi:hypothetical protein Ae201684_013619 [Aphanomyces euteiches]|uniref:Uncharacterized protein n=1 Tax=Aphanomyces euteiches TaxID=100861 RepID=A0A6G0WMX4_9STRA|nr:hypothetical protein Ae201684_013619 [Aphanomyces euteiches]KAH9138352.1 hypothetical protein AeRB84_017308 [Aphanomyces euteiches]
MIFLYIVGEGASNRSAQERFQHSGDTISKVFHQVLSANLLRVPTMMPASLPSWCPNEIQENPKWFPFFKDCIGALDGTHIPAFVPLNEQKPFRNRKGFFSQNVLGVCTFDMRFLYLLAGWEGSSSDGAVLEYAISHGLNIPDGKYFLGDAGYALTRKFITSYRGVRYHLRELTKSRCRPRNAKELYNLRHAQLRNVIERLFGVLKRGFPVLRLEPEYAFETQVKLVQALGLLHNFIHVIGGDDQITRQYDADIATSNKSRKPCRQPSQTFGDEYKLAKGQRDEIAKLMWVQYTLSNR